VICPGQVTYSAILFYGYVGVVGLLVYLALRFYKAGVSLSQVWCTYGETDGRADLVDG
jgi:hypothetical protein